MLKSDYFRIEIEITTVCMYTPFALKSDYFRIEIVKHKDDSKNMHWLKSDYFRIEMQKRVNIFIKRIGVKIRLF